MVIHPSLVATPSRPCLQDKLATTERNYSAQLTMMTEHIFSLNAQIQEQQQELERRPAPLPPRTTAASGAAPSPRRNKAG